LFVVALLLAAIMIRTRSYGIYDHLKHI